MDISKFLLSIEQLSDLNEEELNIISSNATLVEYKATDVLIKRGSISRFLWIMFDGRSDVILTDEKGKDSILATLRRGDIFGEMSIMTGEPAYCNVVCSGECKVVKIPRRIFSKVIIKNLSALSKIANTITKRLIHREKDEIERIQVKSAIIEKEDPYDLHFSSTDESIKILVINCGSSSLKYSLFDTSKSESLIEGLIDKVGTPYSIHKISSLKGKKVIPQKIDGMRDALSAMIAAIIDPEVGVIISVNELYAVGHRVVHGGEKFSNSVVIDAQVINAIKDCFQLAPLHNPYNLVGIEEMQRLLVSTIQVAVFDTAFHQSMPEPAYKYAIANSFYEKEHIRRYGFHGTNHKFVSLKAAMYLNKPHGDLKIISCHLGNGCSICAIDYGRSIDTSMGMTPLEGLVMGTRGGDIDPGIIIYLLKSGLRLEDVDRILNKESGLKGLSGISNDMRNILKAAESGDIHSNNAISIFCYRVKKYIGAYMAILGKIDALIFTGGIGENSYEIRARICQGLESFGIVLSQDANSRVKPQRGKVDRISEPGSHMSILVVPADEERMIARETLHAIKRLLPEENVKEYRTKPIPLSISAHHLHLSEKDFESLFGKGRKLTPKGPLSQKGQFAAEETVNLIGPKGRIERVRILGPFRKETQLEISRTEEFELGIDAPVRDSGDLIGTPGLIIEGDSGKIKIENGVICARRHIHMSAEEALGFGLRDKDVIRVTIGGERELIFGDVLVRVHPSYSLDMHLDTDEANAAEISSGMVGYIDGIQSREYM